MTDSDDSLRLTAAEMDQLEQSLDAEPRVIPELAGLPAEQSIFWEDHAGDGQDPTSAQALTTEAEPENADWIVNRLGPDDGD
ncbi:hypothetical protein [Isoptericola hypogeus]